MPNQKLDIKEITTAGFWNSARRAWVYGIIVALVPLLVAVGTITGDIAQLILNVAAAILAVGGSTLALSNLTPDTVVKVGLTTDSKK